MLNRLLCVTVLGTASVLPLLLTACSSSPGNGPYASTGQSSSIREQARWTDSRGYYHPEWRAGINRPVGYPRSLPGDAAK
jgi:hypothetical protein